ncbi:pyruvate, phosphate dikinase [Oceanicella sp. SM1341]|uniref:pyruvate, phosphate dikinase n=1 Tax=Oceanicella sp. SM1341 TaxID=1548889 RepID=UPI000E48BAA1|nr:pyruvate, phosphate dikinase [Oceanicella sp. SM1341]
MTDRTLNLRDPEARDPERTGERGARLARMAQLGLPVPRGVVLPFDVVADMGREGADAVLEPHLSAALESLGADTLLAVRSSPLQQDWGGPQAILNIGITDTNLPALAARVGQRQALDLYRRLIQSWGAGVAGIDAEDLENILYDRLKLAGVESEEALSVGDLKVLLDDYRAFYLEEVGQPFPQDPATQLKAALEAAAKGWNRPSAKLLRQAKGAPPEAGLALIAQRMALGLCAGNSGAGIAHFIEEKSGKPGLNGRYLAQAQGLDAMMGLRTPILLCKAEREAQGFAGLSLEESCPEATEALHAAGRLAAQGLGDVFDFQFTIENGALHVLDAVPARRSARAAVRVVVDLVEQGAITREQALLRIDPRSLNEHLHPQIDPSHRRDPIGRGLAASPGAASGRIVFTPEAAMSLAAQEVEAILVRVETSPEDIRGMHAASGLLTVRGGMTSHAAVIARGLGLPCVVGVTDIRLDLKAGTLRCADGRVFHEGDVITVDGSRGEALAGAAEMIQPEISGAFGTLMGWADEIRRMRVRANADTPQDARTARAFEVDGIGLCRTEQMFFDEARINVMREMILAETAEERRRALDRLLPMQRGDFVELFEIMAGLQVTIRLLDPPLHEFLPHSRDEMRELAEQMDLPVSHIIHRAEQLQEFNPMLGMRGVRLAVTMPEIYEMQARAIFEAVLEVNSRAEAPVIPEIMIPLVSAAREVELVKARIEAVARDVERETGARLEYRLGVMVETPRAALRAGDLARNVSFMSFGTNDLTQMTYGLSRDDAGRFMRDYVNQGVYPEDPFHALDLEGVGELLLIASRRGRKASPELVLGICGEHAGDPASVRFCELLGFDYVSCSPFRTPIARLAAAQAAILVRDTR